LFFGIVQTGESPRLHPPKDLTDLTGGLSVFTNAPDAEDDQEAAEQPEYNTAYGEQSVTVTMSGNTVNSGHVEAKGGISLFYGPEDPRNESGRISEDNEQSKTNAEIAAVLRAAQKTALDLPLRIESSRQYSNTPTAKTIWKSIRNKDITRHIRTFLWKSLHGAHKIGKYWEHIPECEEWATCQHCGVTEDLEHILLHCTLPGQA
jgi:hypothetical protein